MAVSASFHRNVLLLSQIIQPSDEFRKHFREGMFDKPNTIGFLHISHYLLTIYDSERFKKLIEWPVICKKTEVKYRNNVKDYLTTISLENPDIGFPNILMSHLIHAGGNKFTTIMWKLSEVVVRKYITRETDYNIMFAPQVGPKGHLAKKFVQETNVKVNLNISSNHKNLSEMENATKVVLEKEKEILTNIVREIFEKEQSIEILSEEAPVHPSIKKCLRDINDEEVIKMWRKNVTDGLNRIQKKNSILKGIEQLVSKVNNIISSNSNDIGVLDGKQVQKISCSEISELCSVDKQCLLFQSYKDNKLVLNNFLILFNYLLIQLHQRLKINTKDISKCLLQVEASCKDIKAASNIIQSYLSDIIKLLSESQDILCQKNVQNVVYDDTVSPIMNNVVLMLSPRIKIDTNYNNEESDLQKLLQLTPVEDAHKSLFSRYKRLKQNHTSHGSKLRENLLVSRINFNDTILTPNSENSSLHAHTIFRRNLPTFKQAEKYSRLFSNRTKRANRTANSSIMSIPCSSNANSTALINAIEEIHDMSELNLNISAKSLCNTSAEFITPEKLTAKQIECKNRMEMENIVHELPNKLTIHDVCETIQEKMNNGCDNNVKVEERRQPRRSIGDLVERYKNLLEFSNRTSNSKINCVKYGDK
ncbi:uncharacterized protein LOC100881427 isoform X2 [Megachile rotundata]|uniref:uncharacterized protein LOC100881427 isoform X2 n=1 Tax=Megachile rotundata TaxID=143995 RepID=UPI000258E64D|nr:PREDICTED: uncharacterized protein LOC100881427 isoform X2 [Megachile rotundata]